MSRRGRWIAASVVATLALLCCGIGGTIGLTGLFADETSQPRLSLSGCGGSLVKYHNLPPVAGFNGRQLSYAYTIIKVGNRMKIPPRGWVVAIATALQESGLKVYANNNGDFPLVVRHSMALPHDAVGNDHDSVGLFQQRPSPPEGAGSWGTVKQLMDPATSAKKFYHALKDVPGWRSMPVTVAAQAVQHSSFPDKYAKHTGEATAIVNALTHGAARGALQATAPPSTSDCAGAGQIAASGWVAPVQARITSPYGMRGGVMHSGVDLGAARGTKIRAAAGGIVVTAKCDPETVHCNVDGSIAVAGCGWYVEIKHAGGVETRYCHMVRRPRVHVGQTVRAGDWIGNVGMSGNADGPHLHFEVHLHDDLSSAGATDPVPFMKAKGAPVGKPR